ncbi:Phospholipase D/Transphosphatidylase domain-containing protein [Aphelenchoides fujianensis]|nr:Phospholipase D/Transphosphatidylase domain-containing protein [Aphelenchoides fujianensis]
MTKAVHLLAPVFVAVLLTALLTSGIWLTAYFVGVKPNIKCDDPKGSDPTAPKADPGLDCTKECVYELVESMPWGMFPEDGDPVIRFNSTDGAWKRLMDRAEKQLEITAFYWSLLANDTGDKNFTWDDSAQLGTDVYNQLIEVGKRGVKIGINQDNSSGLYGAYESEHLVQLGYAQTRTLNFTRLVGGGVLHTKSWLVDDKHFYVGSANYDWRSLTQVKELGIAVYDCPCLAADLKKIFDVYAFMGASPDQKVPEEWPAEYSTAYNSKTPMNVRLGDETVLAYFSSSPPPFVPAGREHDGATLARVINNAEQFVYISVMDYAPATFYNGNDNYYWPLIDDAIRTAAFDRRVHVRMLISRWRSTRSEIYAYLHSLRSLDSELPCDRFKNRTTHKWECIEGTKGSIDIKMFEVPKYTVDIAYTRVNHAKYMVTETTSVICTSNWSADYFINTGGISFVVQTREGQSAAKLVEDMRKLHERDWDSAYATSIDEFTNDGQRINKTRVF